jgi:CRISPR-associated protein Cmr1
MASPVILKPVAFSDGTFRPMVAVLSAPQPRTIRIDDATLDLTVPTTDPVLRELLANHPLEAVTIAAEQILGNKRIKL